MPRNKTRLSCLFTNRRRGGERAPAGECVMTSSAFDGGPRDEVVYIKCGNRLCRRAGCVPCWEAVAESLEGWSRKKRNSLQMIQHPIFVALAERAWRADAEDTDVLQREPRSSRRLPSRPDTHPPRARSPTSSMPRPAFHCVALVALLALLTTVGSSAGGLPLSPRPYRTLLNASVACFRSPPLATRRQLVPGLEATHNGKSKS